MTNRDAERAALPAPVAALLDGPITGETVRALRAHYAAAPSSPSRGDEILAIAERVGDRGGPEFQAFLREALARTLTEGFAPFPRARR